jgi:hypothetical protein
MYADSVTKSFLEAGSYAYTQFDDYQDPTYLGFQIKIEPSLNVEGDMDDLPHGLFTLNNLKDPYSCYNYLMNRGETKRAEYILLFEAGFKKLVDEYPWYFIKVSGLADSWKIDTKNNFRGKEKKIVIETLESIDMRVTYLLDLYRKAVFDAAYMRWAVPDHMRYFKMKVIVSEIRPMKLGSVGTESGGAGVFNGYRSEEGTNFKETVSAMISEQEANGQFGLWDTTAPWSAGTFIEFSYEECELDVFNEAPTFLESVGNKPEAEATNKITILTHVINEKNVYGLLGAIINDTLAFQDYDSLSDRDGGGAYYPAFPDFDPVPPADATQADADSLSGYINGYLDRDRAQNFREFIAGEINDELGSVENSAFFVKNFWDPLREPTDSKAGEINDGRGIIASSKEFVENFWDSAREPADVKAGEINDADGFTDSSNDFVKDKWDLLRDTTDSKAGETNDADGFTDNSKDFVKNKWDDQRKPEDSFTSATTDANDINLPSGTYNEVYWDDKHKPEDSKAGEISQSADPGNKSTTEAAKDFDKDHKPEDRKAATISYRRNGLRRAVNRALLGNAYGSSPLTLIGSAQSIINNPVAAIEAILKKHSSPAIGKDLARKVQLTGQEIQLVKSIIGASTTGAEDNVKVNPALVKNQGKTNLDSANINSKDPGKVFLRAPKKAKAKNENSNLTTFANAGSKPGQVKLEGTSPPAARAQKEKLEGPTIIPAKLGKVLLASAPVEKVKLGKTNLE